MSNFNFTKTFSGITKFASTVGRILGRLFLPITFLMTAFDTVTGAIDGFFGTEGNLVQKLLGGLGGAFKGFMKIVTVPMDLVKSLISWIAGKFGFTEFEKLLDGFSFTELFGKAVDWLFVDLPAWFTKTFSWDNILSMLDSALNFANEIGKNLQRIIHGALNWVKSLFGFGDKGDFAEPEMPVTKDVRAFLTFEWVNDLLKPVTDFFKSIMDFDFMGFIKKIPGVGALLDYISGDDESNTVQDAGMKEQQERTKRMKQLQSDLKSGDVEGFNTEANFKKARDELKKRNSTKTSFSPSYSTLQIGKISGGIGANVIADQCSLEWEVRPVNKDDGIFVSKNIDTFVKDILLPEMKKNNPKGNIKKEIIGEVVGFNKEETSEAVNLVCNLTGDNAKETMSFGTEAGLFQNSGISTVICGPGSIEQAHTVDEYITFDQLKKCLKMLISLQEKMVN